MSEQAIATKLVWSVTPHGILKENLETTINFLHESRINLFHSIYSHYMKDFIPKFKQLWHSSGLVNQFSQHGPTFMFELVGRQCQVCVPNGETYLADGVTIDVHISVDFNFCAQNIIVPSLTEALEVKVSNADQLSKLKAGSTLNISYGTVQLLVTKVTKQTESEFHLQCEVVEGGTIFSGTKLHSDDISRTLFPLLPEDNETLDHKFHHSADYILLSGVRSESEILHIKKMILGSDSKLSSRHPSVSITPEILNADTQISPRFILKVGSSRSLEMMSKVLPLVDGVLISRSELGLDKHPHSLGILQKQIMEVCHKNAKLVIVSSDFMQSMRYNPSPTRAEVSDIANAMEDGTDAVMIAPEVTQGPYAQQVSKISRDVLFQADQWRVKTWQSYQLDNIVSDDDAVLYGTMRIAEQADVSAIVCFTEGGYTAYKLSSMRTPKTIIAVTCNKRIFRQLNMLSSVQPVLLSTHSKTEQLLTYIKSILMNQFGFRTGEKFVFISLTTSSVSARNSNLFTLQEID